MTIPSTPAMTHEEAFAEIGALVIGALSADEERAVMTHIEECAECQAELAAMKEVATQLPALDSIGEIPAERSRSIRDSLVARASASTSAAAPVQRAGFNYWKPLALAASAAIVALGLAYSRERTESRRLAQIADERSAVTDSLSRAIRGRDDLLQSITGPSVSVVELSSDAVQAPTARMFWDRATNRWTMYAHGLPQPAPGRAYELWLVTADAKIPAGVFKPSPDGTATFTATYALEPSQLQAIAVTDEPEAGVPAPTGPIVLIGSAAAPR